MTRVCAPSRLHFGLLSFGAADPGMRRFGGAGLMVQAPGVAVAASPAQTWSAEGPLAERALAFAHRLTQPFPSKDVLPLNLKVERSAPEHLGLGTGTQLGLAVARAVTTAWGMPDLDPTDLARRVGRGKRSALGIHGFAHGGFLVEGGKRNPDTIAPLVARVEFPEAWRVVLVLPPGPPGLHDEAETQAFERLRSAGAAELTDRLCRLVLLGMLPALVERDLEGFGEAVHDFNAHVGEAFAPVQGGRYANAAVAEVVAFVRQQGVRGVGQSSWGPAVFAVVGDEEHAASLAQQLRDRFGWTGTDQVLVTQACNRGATTEGGLAG